MLDAEIDNYFHEYGIWREYAKDHLWRVGRISLQDYTEQFLIVPTNYLWVVAIFYATRYKSTLYVFSTELPPRVGNLVSVGYYGTRYFELDVTFSGASLPFRFTFGNMLNRMQIDFVNWDLLKKIEHYVVSTPGSLFTVLYTLMKMGLYLRIDESTYIRSKLNTF